MKTYICKEPVAMSRERFDYLNKVLLVNFDDTDLTMQELIKELSVEPNSSSIETLYWEFENGSFIYEDIYIGDENAYDDVRWYANAQDYPETFDCRYEIAETMKFYVSDAEYICKIQIKENDDKGEDSMKKKEYLGKLETLSSNIDNWIDTTYVPECMKNATAFKYNSIRTALIITWFDAINICIDNFADDTFNEDEMPFDVDDYLKFFEKHTLDDCAETFLCFRHPDRFDPFGFSEDGFLAQIELLNTIIEEIKKEDN